MEPLHKELSEMLAVRGTHKLYTIHNALYYAGNKILMQH